MVSHTLHNLDHLTSLLASSNPKNPDTCTVYNSFLKLFTLAGPVSKPAPPPTMGSLNHGGVEVDRAVTLTPLLSDLRNGGLLNESKLREVLTQGGLEVLERVPSMVEMGYPPLPRGAFPGGESHALGRLETILGRQGGTYVRDFAKPNTSPNSLEPSTTVLSPYLKFGCLSVRYMWYALRQVYQGEHEPDPLFLRDAF